MCNGDIAVAGPFIRMTIEDDLDDDEDSDYDPATAANDNADMGFDDNKDDGEGKRPVVSKSLDDNKEMVATPPLSL